MIIYMTKDHTPQQSEIVLERIRARGLHHDVSHGETGIDVIGVLGDVSRLEEGYFLECAGVDKVVRISKPYKLVSRQFQPQSKIVRVGAVAVGGAKPVIMAGPCAVESEGQLMAAAAYVAELGIPILRGGAYKPRTSPYSYQGMGRAGLLALDKARKKYGLKIITEAAGMHRHPNRDGTFEEKNVLENVLEFADIVQVGARNMKSYGFLQELALKTRDDQRPIMLKRGESSTLKDFMLAAEYIVSCGNPNVILCLRGIRAFEEESFQRYTPDIGAITVLKQETNLPVLFDPSHASGYRNNVYSLSMAAIAAGADGLLIETHPDPSNALCDGEQSITAAQLASIKQDAEKIAALFAEKQRASA